MYKNSSLLRLKKARAVYKYRNFPECQFKQKEESSFRSIMGTYVKNGLLFHLFIIRFNCHLRDILRAHLMAQTSLTCVDSVSQYNCVV